MEKNLFLLPLCLLPACRAHEPAAPVIVFHAAALSRALGEAEELFERKYPDLDLRLEPSGSQVAARKVSELNRPADVVLSADERVIDELLVPEHAAWQLLFAGNEIVLAFGEHSPGGDALGAENWPETLQRPGVRLGRCDENTSPLGFQTLAVWLLAEEGCLGRPRPQLAEKLKSRVSPQQVTADVEELVAQLEARTLDYAFLFRSVAEEYNLQRLRLPDACNLGNLDLRESYARVRVPVALKAGGPPAMLAGAPVIFGLTIPRSAPNPAGAERFVEFLLGDEGRRQLIRSGFRPIAPPRCRTPESLPARLRSLVEGR